MQSTSTLLSKPTIVQLMRGVFIFLEITISTFSLGSLVIVIGLVRILTPSRVAKQALDRLAVNIANKWICFNSWLIDHAIPRIEWHLTLPSGLSTEKQYLLICNHQSWVDTTVMQHIGLPRMPLTRFFTKWELIFIPFLGLAFKILGFPMMKRHDKAAITKNPALKLQDILEAKRACEGLLDQPFTLLNYLEGTRFTHKKHADQQSPYPDLLKPKSGGIGLAIQILGKRVDSLIDMTIVYPDGIPGYGDFWMGRVRRIGVDLHEIQIPEWALAGDYEEDQEFRVRFQTWISELWANKQSTIDQIMSRFNDSNTPISLINSKNLR